MRTTSVSLVFLVSITVVTTACDGDGDGVDCPEGMSGFALDGEGVCVDSTEFTNAMYAEFLNEFGNVCEEHECMHADEPGSRIHQVPDGEEGAGEWRVEAGYEEHPVVRVTFHGALEACALQDKRLCSEEEWGRGCGGPLEDAYPYGDSYEEDACNGAIGEEDDGAPVEVGSMSLCEGGYDGLFDMSGNVYEWVSTCADGPCNIKGGSFDRPEDELSCQSTHEMDGPAGHREDLGFRCCFDG